MSKLIDLHGCATMSKLEIADEINTLKKHCPDISHHILTQGWRATFKAVGHRTEIAALNAAASKRHIRNQQGIPIKFVSQAQPAGQRHYEEKIYHTGCVPTRPESLHDFYNACAWLTFPKTKAALNAIHVEQPLTQNRSRLSDTATLFDESGAVLIGPNPTLAGLLMNHQWAEAFVTRRDCWRDHHLIVLGHSVLEKLHAPYPGMIVKAVYQPWSAVQQVDEASIVQELDEVLATRWQAAEFTQPSDLFPIPVMGIPGADPDNEQASYYENRVIFRPKKRRD